MTCFFCFTTKGPCSSLMPCCSEYKCIEDTFVCDGVVHCVGEDGNDETNCSGNDILTTCTKINNTISQEVF